MSCNSVPSRRLWFRLKLPLRTLSGDVGRFTLAWPQVNMCEGRLPETNALLGAGPDRRLPN
jgi:hypothetical protein